MPRLAKSLATLRWQIDAHFPTRSTASDGWIGDAAHQARVSQHNPNDAGVVCAIDVTEDLSVGLDCNKLMDELDALNDPRLYYTIHDREIDNSDDSRTPYYGSNPHTKHIHISVRWDQPALYDNGVEWKLPMLGWRAPKPVTTVRDLKLKDTGADVRKLQRALVVGYPAYRHEHGELVVDGIFGKVTLAWVKEFQTRSGLKADGIVGAKTRAKLGL